MSLLEPPSGISSPPSASVMKLVTRGRATGLPHVVVARFVFQDRAFFVLAGRARSDWVLNALGTGRAKVRIGELAWEGSVSRASPDEHSRALELFSRKYGRRLTYEWYSRAETCAKIVPTRPASRRGATGGEAHVTTTLEDWRRTKTDYYQGVAEAFDSASEEYDFTIRRNFINSWIRERSIRELLAVTKKDDFLLEIGCGTGSEAIQIAKRVKGILATDISSEMIALLERKIEALKLQRKIQTMRVGAMEVSSAADRLPGGSTPVAYSFNGALNCEPGIREVPAQLSRVISAGGYFVCSIRNSFCLSEALAHGAVLQMDKLAPRKKQPIMVSVGGLDIPSYYYRPSEFVRFFAPYFKAKRIMGLPAFLPPAYLSDIYFRARRVLSILERTETAAAASFPFNRFGDQTLFVFQRT